MTLNLFAGFLIVASLLAPIYTEAQTVGCTDPTADNYNPSASINDGSCLYAPTNYSPAFVTYLSDSLRETSGLASFGGYLWTQNDSGNARYIYALDTLQGTILRSVWISNAPNIDWESLAQSDTHLYIGDFGNNSGNRMDLRIFRISLDSILLADTVSAEIIIFTYPDQQDFTPASNNNEYDCEAFYFWKDSLHLFTKNWVSQTTRYYTLPATPGQYEAALQDSFNTEGLITGAAIQADGNVALCGYKNIGSGIWTCFAWLLFDYPEGNPFGGNKRKISLGSALTLGQMEAVWLNDNGTGWLSGESISIGPITFEARLSLFDFKTFLQPSGTAFEEVDEPTKISLNIFPNPSNGVVSIEIFPPDPGMQDCQIYVSDSLGRTVLLLENLSEDPAYMFSTTSLPPGTYQVTLVLKSQAVASQYLIVE